MLILDRHFLVRWMRLFLASLSVCLLLILLADLFGLIDHFIDQKPSPSVVLLYVVYRVGYLLFFLLPLGLMIGGYLFLHTVREHNEWTVVLGAGVSPPRLLRAPLLTLVLLTLAAVAYGLVIVPGIAERMETFREQRIKGKPSPSTRFKNVHLKLPDGRILTLGMLDPNLQRIRDLRLTRKRNNRIVERWDAKRGTYNPTEGWTLHEVLIRRFRPSGRVVETEHERRKLQLEPPSMLRTVLLNDPRRRDQHPSYYRLRDLLTAIQFRTHRGMNALSERVYLHWKFGFPLIVLVLGLAGMMLGLYTPYGRAWGLGIAVVAGFGYWILYNTSIALGQSTTLQTYPLFVSYAPLAAAYGPPLLCLALLLGVWSRRND